MTVQVQVANTGTRAGEEVVQLYVRPLQATPGAAQQELRGFQRIHLKPGERRTVSFELAADAALRRYDEASKAYAVAPGRYEVRVGASSADLRANGQFDVKAAGR